MPRSPIRYDGVLARRLPQLARLGIASLPPPYARIWGDTTLGDDDPLSVDELVGVPGIPALSRR